MSEEYDSIYFDPEEIQHEEKETKKTKKAIRKRKQDKTEFQEANERIKKFAHLENGSLGTLARTPQYPGENIQLQNEESIAVAKSRIAERRANVDQIIQQYERETSKGRLRGASNVSLNFFLEKSKNNLEEEQRHPISARELQIFKKLKVIRINAQCHPFGLGGKIKSTKSSLFPQSPLVSPTSSPNIIIDQPDVRDN